MEKLVCTICHKNVRMSHGGGRYRKHCRACHYEKYGKPPCMTSVVVRRRKAGTKHVTKGACCGVCGFVPEHDCQLDLDHIDGNRRNNAPGNLQTLCANCHRLKTYNSRDWLQAA